MKQRLIGAIVLGCLAIIFIPIVLDGEGVTSVEMTRDIPPSPETPTIPQIEATRPVIRADSDALDIEAPTPQVNSSTATELATSNPASSNNDSNNETESQASTDTRQPATIVEIAEADRPRLNTQGLPETWSVRLASFGSTANANKLLIRLLDAGYKGYSRPVESSQGSLRGVFVGPVLSRNEATQLLAELEQEFELKGIVVQFTIEELGQ